MKGLIIKSKWADLILSGEKTWEICGSRTHQRGRIGIIKSGSGKIYGYVDIVDCILTVYAFSENLHQHHVSYGQIDYKTPFAWVMQNAIRLPDPIPYNHPQGAVIWVNLN